LIALTSMDNPQTNFSDNPITDGLLHIEAKRSVIDGLYADGFLTAPAYDAGLSHISRQRHWATWINRSLLFSGTALTLAGIIYFFAYNWSRLPSMAKFSMVEIVLAGCLVGAWKVGLDKIAGQVLLLAASMMVGVFLAVFGQIYQTGADSYELFVAWAVLISAWVLIGRFGALWIMWLVLINVSLILYFFQVADPNYHVKADTLVLVLAALNGAALVAREAAYLKGRVEWLAQNWLRWVLLISVLGYLLIPAEGFIVEFPTRLVSPLSFLTMIAVLSLAVITYRFTSPDLFALTQCALVISIMFLTLIARVLLHESNPATWLLFGLIVVITVSVMAFALRLTGISMAKEAKRVQS
jgi:uncharacterized membrane protein